MRWTTCACGAGHLERIPRSWWMRLFRSRRHYRCSDCGATMFVRKLTIIRGPVPPIAQPLPVFTPQPVDGSQRPCA